MRASPAASAAAASVGRSTPCIGGPDYEQLVAVVEQMLQLAQANPGLANVDTQLTRSASRRSASPIDRNRAADLGVSLETVGRTLETVLGSRIVTTYIDRGREYNVILQGRDDDRARRPPTSRTSACARRAPTS